MQDQDHKCLGWSPWSVGWWRGLAVDYCRPLVAAQPPPSRTLLLSFILLSFRLLLVDLFVPAQPPPSTILAHPPFILYRLMPPQSTSFKIRFHLVSKAYQTWEHSWDAPTKKWSTKLIVSRFLVMYHVFHPWSHALLYKVYSWSAISGSNINYYYRSCLAVQKNNCTDYSRVVSGKPHL